MPRPAALVALTPCLSKLRPRHRGDLAASRRVPAAVLLCLSILAVVSCSAVWASAASATSYSVAGWGENKWGELGDGTNTGPEKCPPNSPTSACSLYPVAVSGIGSVRSVGAGAAFACAVLAAGGGVDCWGRGERGELGNGELLNKTTPVAVSGISGAIAVATGGFHACALLGGGGVDCWGNNEQGQLGNGTLTSSSVPVAVSGITNAVAVSAGHEYSCAVLVTGSVECWGDNVYGELGNGTLTSSSTPVTVSGITTAKAVGTGFDTSCAVLASGKLECWGFQKEGSLGNGGGAAECYPERFCSAKPVPVSNITTATAVSLFGYTGCALLSTGTEECWGENLVGDLGNGTATSSVTPTQVTGLTGISSIGGTCAVLTGGSLYCWGANSWGELGIGTEVGPETCPGDFFKEVACSEKPVAVSGITGVADVSHGGDFQIAGGSGQVPNWRPEESYGTANPANPNQTRSCTPKPVNCATGNESVAQTDLSVGGLGVSLTLTRTYNAQAAVTQSSPGLFGFGWSASFTDHLSINAEAKTVTVVQANGSTVLYDGTGEPGPLSGAAGVQAKLVLNSDGTYTYTLPNQQVEHFLASGLMFSASDRNGNTSTLNRNAEGRLESITDPAGRKLSFTYTGEGEIETAKDPMGHIVKYGYEAGSLTSVTLPGEASPRWQFKYDGSHRLIKLTDGRGGVSTIEYDAANRVTSLTDPAERTLTFGYGEHHTTITNHATGAVTSELFTAAGEPELITKGWGTPLATTEALSYDSTGALKTATDGDGHTTEYGYDSEGNRTSTRDPAGDETKWGYDAKHDVTSVTTPKGETTTIKRDSHGNPEVGERPAPESKTEITKYKFNSLGELEAVTDPLERTTKFEYNSQGDRTAEVDPEGDKRTWSYDEDSRERSSVSPRGNVEGAEASKYTTAVERDPQGRALVVTDPLGHKTRYAYDANGNLESSTDPNGHTTKYTYDADNEQIKIEQPNGAIAETGYDGAGKVTSQTDGNKHTTTYVRNVLEQVVAAVDPLLRKTVSEYDKAGNLRKLTDAAKRTTTDAYDPANRLKEVSYSDGKTHAVQYEYDADGDRTKMVDAAGTATYTYDQLDRLTENKDGHGDVMKYEYDLANERTKITYPNSKAIVRTFDKAGRLKTVTDWLEHTTGFAYNPDSGEIATTFPSGTSNEDRYTYDEADQLSEAKLSKGTETLASLAYTRDNDGQVKATTSKGLPGEENANYEYDANNRLTKGATVGYEYDAADNPTKTGASTNTFDSADELKTGTGVSYSYDEVGERIKRTPVSGPTMTYGYNQAGEMTLVERAKEGKVAGFTDTYVYNGDGLRASQTISGTTTFLAWNTAEGLPLLLNDGTNSFIYGPEGLPIEQIDNEGKVLYLHHDQQGSTRLLTGPTGAKEATFTYDAYGNTTGTTGAVRTALGYDAQLTSPDSGLIYLRARTYDPATAQFLSVDPLAMSTREPYVYVGDNPATYGDRSGLDAGEIEVPCVWPFCGPPPPVIEGIETIGRGVVEGAEITWHEVESGWNEFSGNTGPGCSPAADGEALRREGEQLLGRKHGEAARERWREWWAKLGPAEKKAYNNAKGPKPRKGG